MTADLTKYSTQALLTALRRVSTDKAEVELIHKQRAELGDSWMWEWTKDYWDARNSTGWLGPDVTAAELKVELAKREHIPNKIERKAMRRQKAQMGRHRGRRDR